MIVDVLVNPYAFAVGGELLAALAPGSAAPAVVIVSTIKAEQLIAVIAAFSLGRPSHGGRRPRSLKGAGGAPAIFWSKAVSLGVSSPVFLATTARDPSANTQVTHKSN
jgi:hypothetical protein